MLFVCLCLCCTPRNHHNLLFAIQTQAGLHCHINGQCVCPDAEENCQTTWAVETHRSLCSHDANITALGLEALEDDSDDDDDDDYHDHGLGNVTYGHCTCMLTDGLALTGLSIQGLMLPFIFIVACLYWYRLSTHNPHETTEAVGFFRSLQFKVGFFVGMVVIAKGVNFVYAVYYARYGVLWELWNEHLNELSPDGEQVLTTISIVIDNLLQGGMTAFCFFAPIMIFLQILSSLPAPLIDLRCHIIVVAINSSIYLAIRLVFGYVYGQSFGYLPFTYLLSAIQVCVENPGSALVNELEAGMLLEAANAHAASMNGVSPTSMPAVNTTTSTATTATTATATARLDVSQMGSSYLEVLSCTEIPGVLWVGIAAVTLWELFLFSQLLKIRGAIEQAILKVPYPQYRAIILYYRFWDALWRLLSWMMCLLGGFMALANPPLFRWMVSPVCVEEEEEEEDVFFLFLSCALFGWSAFCLQCASIVSGSPHLINAKPCQSASNRVCFVRANSMLTPDCVFLCDPFPNMYFLLAIPILLSLSLRSTFRWSSALGRRALQRHAQILDPWPELRRPVARGATQVPWHHQLWRLCL